MNKINNEFEKPILKSSSILTFQTKNVIFQSEESVAAGIENYMDAKLYDLFGSEIIWNLYGTVRVAELHKRFLR